MGRVKPVNENHPSTLDYWISNTYKKNDKKPAQILYLKAKLNVVCHDLFNRIVM